MVAVIAITAMVVAAVVVMREETWCKALQVFDGPANGTDYELSLSVPVIPLKRQCIENHLDLL